MVVSISTSPLIIGGVVGSKIVFQTLFATLKYWGYFLSDLILNGSQYVPLFPSLLNLISTRSPSTTKVTGSRMSSSPDPVSKLHKSSSKVFSMNTLIGLAYCKMTTIIKISSKLNCKKHSKQRQFIKKFRNKTKKPVTIWASICAWGNIVMDWRMGIPFHIRTSKHLMPYMNIWNHTAKFLFSWAKDVIKLRKKLNNPHAIWHSAPCEQKNNPYI